MRTLKLQMQTSIDGLVAGPDGEMDWMVWDWDDDLKKFVDQITDPVDCILLGRKLAGGFISHWTSVAADPEHPEHDAGKKFSNTPKKVFSKSLETSAWENAEVVGGDLVQEVEKLKEADGGDLIVYGGATFVSSLLRESLVDQLYLFVNPVVLGAGMPIFKQMPSPADFELKAARSYPCGIAVLVYEQT